MATRLWSFLTADIRDLAIDATRSAADAADTVLGLAEALAEENANLQKLAPLVNQIDSLLAALNAPLGKLIHSTRPLGSMGIELLKVYLEATQKEPTLAQSVALISQAAYLESFREFVKQHPKVERWLVAKDSTPQAKTITLEMKALSIFELSDQDARLAALHFQRSALAAAFNNALRARLVQLGIDDPKMANRIVEVIAKNTSRHMKTAIADAESHLNLRVE